MKKSVLATTVIVAVTAFAIAFGMFSPEYKEGTVTNVPEVKVYVKGEVVNPGVYELPVTARITDAIESAGGVTENGDASNLDLARFVVDGETVTVPDISGNYDDSPGGIERTKININTAGKEQLKLIPGIGDTMAERIIEYREANGSFEVVEDLLNVSGIGMGMVEKIKDYICVE